MDENTSTTQNDEGTSTAKPTSLPLVDTPAHCVQDFSAFSVLLQRAEILHRRVDGKKSVKAKRFQLDCEIAAFCRGCEVARECGLIAQENTFTGIAGGHVVRSGKTRSTLIAASPSGGTGTSAAADDDDDDVDQKGRGRAV